MSTKIFNAYRYTGRVRNPGALFALSSRIRTTLLEFSQNAFFVKAGRELARAVDRASIGMIGAEEGANAENALGIVSAAHAAATKRVAEGVRAPSWDFSAEWVFHFVNQRLLLRVFAEQAVVDAFEKAFPQFVDYHFQDSTDRPSEIPAAEWWQRRRDWDKCIGSRSSAETGLAMSLWGTYGGPSLYHLDEVLAQTPALADRASELGSDIVGDARFKARFVGRTDVKPHEVVSALNDWADDKTKPNTRNEIAARIAELARVLPATIGRKEALASLRTLQDEAAQRKTVPSLRDEAIKQCTSGATAGSRLTD